MFFEKTPPFQYDTSNAPVGVSPSRRLNLFKYDRQHVVILLALYEGAACLPDQLHSFKCQSHDDWSLLVSDDGSKDDGVSVVQCFARAERQRDVRIVKGPQAGFAMNFLHLVNKVSVDAPLVAFSDQDDVWLPEKLSRAIGALSALDNDTPAVYCGRTWICSPTLRKMRRSPWFRKTPHFRNAIVQSIGGGNTMVLNNAALRLIQEASMNVKAVTSHDWWVYQMVAGAGGRVIYDDEPMVLYRQHDGNVIGAGDGLAALFGRLWMVLARQFQGWNTVNERALVQSSSYLTKENRRVLSTFRRLRRTHLFDRIKHLRRSGIHHQTVLGNMGLWLAVFLNRI